MVVVKQSEQVSHSDAVPAGGGPSVLEIVPYKLRYPERERDNVRDRNV